MSTAVGKTVFVLGRETDGNRTAYVVENAEEYSVDLAAKVVYTDDTAQFPYVLV